MSSDYSLGGPTEKSHDVELDEGDTVRIVFNTESGAVRWRLTLPNGQAFGSTDEGDQPPPVERTDDGAIVYRANQTGTHHISISTEPYTQAAYSIYIEDI